MSQSKMLATFFESISWPMEPPPAYGAFHILFTLIGFAVCGFSAWKLRNVSDKTAGRILFACGLVLSLSEVFKQFFLYLILQIGENTHTSTISLEDIRKVTAFTCRRLQKQKNRV